MLLLLAGCFVLPGLLCRVIPGITDADRAVPGSIQICRHESTKSGGQSVYVAYVHGSSPPMRSNPKGDVVFQAHISPSCRLLS